MPSSSGPWLSSASVRQSKGAGTSRSSGPSTPSRKPRRPCCIGPAVLLGGGGAGAAGDWEARRLRGGISDRAFSRRKTLPRLDVTRPVPRHPLLQ